MGRPIIAGVLHGTVGSDIWTRNAYYNDGANELVCEGEVRKEREVRKEGDVYVVKTRSANSQKDLREIGRPKSASLADSLLMSEIGHLARVAAEAGGSNIQFKYD
jgi:hypothetical protein